MHAAPDAIGDQGEGEGMGQGELRLRRADLIDGAVQRARGAFALRGAMEGLTVWPYQNGVRNVRETRPRGAAAAVRHSDRLTVLSALDDLPPGAP